MDQDKLNEILKKHKKWALGEKGGERANLRGAALKGANLQGANLWGANLQRANLQGANLKGANLWGADLKGANLKGANLRGADLRGAECEFSICPEEGSFIGFKKAKDNIIVKLEITSNALRSSATTRKCRCSKAKVLDIYSYNNKEVKYKEAVSTHDSGFIYKVGEIVEVENFDTNRWNECSTGIHFFLTEEEARRY